MNDDNEIIRLACEKCKASKEGTYKELFGDLPSLILLPKINCKCGGEITLGMTGTYKLIKQGVILRICTDTTGLGLSPLPLIRLMLEQPYTLTGSSYKNK